MDSAEIKVKVLHYFRFIKRFLLISTEAGYYESDILVSNNTPFRNKKHNQEVIEVEVKVSRTDLRNDFKKKKHKVYASNSVVLTPNRFYFAVPKELVEYAIELCKNLPYGVIEVSDVEFRPTKYVRKVEKVMGQRSKAGAYIFVRKSAKLIHKTYPYQLDRYIINRMGSDLIREKLVGYRIRLGRIIPLLKKLKEVYKGKNNEF